MRDRTRNKKREWVYEKRRQMTDPDDATFIDVRPQTSYIEI